MSRDPVRLEYDMSSGSGTRKSFNAHVPSRSPNPSASRFSRSNYRGSMARDDSSTGSSKDVTTPGSSLRKSKIFEKGDQVKVKAKYGPRWREAVIVRKNFNDTYDVQYNDTQEFDDNVTAARIALSQGSSSSSSGNRESEENKSSMHDIDEGPSVTAHKYKDFEKVMALYQGRGDYVEARVMKVHSNGSLDLRYDNGREDTLGKMAIMIW